MTAIVANFPIMVEVQLALVISAALNQDHPVIGRAVVDVSVHKASAKVKVCT